MDLEERITKEKGASDLLAYYVHQPLENRMVARLMHTPVTPNQVTIATNLIAYTRTWASWSTPSTSSTSSCGCWLWPTT